ncbi:MAG: GTP pyrophosphokinase [Bacteroidetes bacterium GWF2_38_335]|nr:MAG: GTP pyrophosphokinase [Bacteroidetes bacterium GWF2_38_335]OFY77441.1 MAG: GTP pyrophosphokinase [Bacteroidetes bacterium RIFOXYA12_FULL_38_20]HBS87270.1 GTP pyrophosphokinase [Bacteroidales bacterium]
MANLTEEEVKELNRQYEEIFVACPRCRNDEAREVIKKAYDLAFDAHKEMRRKSGEPYLIHPIEVAKIVGGEIGLGSKAVTCSLLHDVVEDTDYTLEDIQRMFGDKIASIIDGLTKISSIFDQESSLQAENFRKMLMTLSDDVRVILIKLADRLHNMRTLDSMPRHKQMKIASETLFLYAPLAHRLGLYAIKTELEDLSLKYEHPIVYQEIFQKVKDSEKKRQAYINKFSLPIIDKLTENKVNYNITGRPKSIYSIWKKMQDKNVPFEEVYDIFAIRIIFDAVKLETEKSECWNIYSLITDIYQPNPDRLRDWVSTPKANGYEALHTTVMGPEGVWVEVQIRSKRMDEIAERGYAAHWKYKGEGDQENELDKWIKKIRELLESPESDALEFLDEFKMNLYSSEIFVFTPKGQLKRLPKSATALDFAYEIHSGVGCKAIGAKVNHKLVPLSHELKSGDQVEIITTPKQTPQREWLDFVITAKARSNIKSSFKDERRSQLDKGKEILEQKLIELNYKPSSEIFKKLVPGFNVRSREELYRMVGRGLIDLDDVKKIITKKSKNKFIRYWQLQLTRRGVQKKIKDQETKPQKPTKKIFLDDDKENLDFIIAKCCNPIPGDEVMGFVNLNDTVTIHKTDCSNAIKLMSSYGERVVSAQWKTQKLLSFLARIKLKGIDNIGLVNKITTIISKELDVNMRTIYFDSHDGIFEGYIDLYVYDTDDLNELIKDIRRIKGIDSVSRATEVEDAE